MLAEQRIGRGRAAAALALLLVAAQANARQQEPEIAAPAATAPAETFPAEVRLHLLYRFGREVGERPAPGITVVLGVGEGAFVHGPESLPLELHRPVLATAMSNENGLIRATVPVPNDWRDRAWALWARVETPGHVRALRWLQPGGESQKLLVQRGSTLFGRALTADGAPVAGADAWLLRENDEGDFELADSAESLPNGTFALRYFDARPHGIHVRHAELGSSPRLVLDLDPARPPESVELRVRGGPDTHGKLIDPFGAPVRGAFVTAVPQGHAPAPTPAACFAAEAEGGLLGGRVRVDGEGSFVLPRLLPGVYDLYTRYSPMVDTDDNTSVGEHGLGNWVGISEVKAGSEPLLLGYKAHRLEVRVLDAEGKPVFPAPDEKGVIGLPALSLTDVAEEFRWLYPVFVDDLVVFPVEQGRDYLLSWREDEVPYVERRFSIGKTPLRIPVTLELGPRGAPAELELHFREPDGTEFERAKVKILASESGRTVFDSIEPGEPAWNRIEKATWSTTFPPGRYRVQVSTEPLTGCILPPLLERTPFLPVVVEVELRAGQREVVEVRFGAAGHIDFEGNARLPDWKQLVERGTDRGRRSYGGARLFLVSAQERVPFQLLAVHGFHDQDWIVPGWPGRGLSPLPPGDWTLQAERAGETVFETPVHIEAGQVTTVRW